VLSPNTIQNNCEFEVTVTNAMLTAQQGNTILPCNRPALAVRSPLPAATLAISYPLPFAVPLVVASPLLEIAENSP